METVGVFLKGDKMNNIGWLLICMIIFWAVTVYLAYRLGFYEGFNEAKIQCQKWIDKHIIRRGEKK